MKLDKKRILVAVFAASTIALSSSSKAVGMNRSAYVDDGNLVISEFNSYSIIIDEEELDNFENIKVQIGDKEVVIDSETIKNLKEEAQRQNEDLQRYELIIYTSAGVITIIVVRQFSKIKRK